MSETEQRGVCAGGKKPTARSIKQDFETFLKVSKSAPAWRKDFFDTLVHAAVCSVPFLSFTGHQEAGGFVLRKLQDVALTAVENRRAAVLVDQRKIHAVGHMDVAVEQIPGLVLVQQGEKRLEAPVRQVVGVAVAPRGGVGQYNIHAPGAVELPAQAVDSP